MKYRLIRIEAPHFVAGAVWYGKKCIWAAPILQWMIGKSPQAVKSYLEKKGWQYVWVQEWDKNGVIDL